MPHPLDRFLSDEYTLVDTETTGLKAYSAAMTEIAAMKIRFRPGMVPFEILGTWHSMINPMMPVPEIITKLTGITDEMVKTAAPIEEVFPQFLAFLGDGIIVTHNVEFDLAFLNTAAKKVTGAALPNQTVCTLKLSQRLFPQLKRHKLDSMAEFIGSKGRHGDSHRAELDVLVLADVFAGIRPAMLKQIIESVCKKPLIAPQN